MTYKLELITPVLVITLLSLVVHSIDVPYISLYVGKLKLLLIIVTESNALFNSEIVEFILSLAVQFNNAYASSNAASLAKSLFAAGAILPLLLEYVVVA